MLRRRVFLGICPFLQGRREKTFGLAVGLRREGPCESVLDAPVAASSAKLPGGVATAIVRKHPADMVDAMAPEIDQPLPKESPTDRCDPANRNGAPVGSDGPIWQRAWWWPGIGSHRMAVAPFNEEGMNSDLSTCWRMPGIFVEDRGVSPSCFDLVIHTVTWIKALDNLLKSYSWT